VVIVAGSSGGSVVGTPPRRLVPIRPRVAVGIVSMSCQRSRSRPREVTRTRLRTRRRLVLAALLRTLSG
jgi:hypothetical protein